MLQSLTDIRLCKPYMGTNLIWGTILRNNPLQKKTMKIMTTHPRNIHLSPLFKNANILKFEDKILIGNISS